MPGVTGVESTRGSEFVEGSKDAGPGRTVGVDDGEVAGVRDHLEPDVATEPSSLANIGVSHRDGDLAVQLPVHEPDRNVWRQVAHRVRRAPDVDLEDRVAQEVPRRIRPEVQTVRRLQVDAAGQDDDRSEAVGPGLVRGPGDEVPASRVAHEDKRPGEVGVGVDR